MKTVNWYKVLFIFTLLLFICYFISECGNKKQGQEDYIWQDKLDSLKHEYSVKFDSMEIAHKNADLYHIHKQDSLTLLINRDEPKTIVQYKDKHIKDSVINSYSIDELSRKLTTAF